MHLSIVKQDTGRLALAELSRRLLCGSDNLDVERPSVDLLGSGGRW
jgi:hypothetical protein